MSSQLKAVDASTPTPTPDPSSEVPIVDPKPPEPLPLPPSEPKPDAPPAVFSAISIAFYDGFHVMHTTIAHVLSVSPVDESQKAELTVAYPDPAADPVILASANWQRGYVRITGVKHVSDPAVLAGQESIAWGGTITIADPPTIPQPVGDAERPYFTRADDPVAVQVSRGQAAAVQSGKAPLPTTQTPLLNEPVSTPAMPEPVSEPKPAPLTAKAVPRTSK